MGAPPNLAAAAAAAAAAVQGTCWWWLLMWCLLAAWCRCWQLCTGPASLPMQASNSGLDSSPLFDACSMT
jgi:hypothetical protein